jgi:hypothetical protein
LPEFRYLRSAEVGVSAPPLDYQPVCPNCGRPPGDRQVCLQCGLNLSKWRHLPLRADWEAELAALAEYRAKRAARRERRRRQAAWLKGTRVGRFAVAAAARSRWSP